MLHERLPRELRGRLYPEVEIVQDDLYTYVSESDLTPVAVEMVPSEPLTTFVHPENALYVFGPEDGHLGKAILSHCHRVVHIPSNHCLNLAGAIYVTLYDRLAKSES
jgi:tRNA(Leu) C34 or U34 (ribose-2'-O)-methylase TrmL